MIPHTVSDESQLVSFRLPPKVMEKLDSQARNEMRSRANLARKIIADYYGEA